MTGFAFKGRTIIWIPDQDKRTIMGSAIYREHKAEITPWRTIKGGNSPCHESCRAGKMIVFPQKGTSET